MTSFIRNIGADLFSLFYPAVCAGCGNTLVTGEKLLCLGCHMALPRTFFVPGQAEPNPVEKLFHGRVKLNGAASFLYFKKSGLTQILLHQLKYKGRQELGEYLGTLFGMALADSGCFHPSDLVVPVPLHRRKLLQRGYNQSDCIAKGIAASLQLQADTNLMRRAKATATQTRKRRYERWENVSDIFTIPAEKEEFTKNRHIWLVDDVITTGATIESCAALLLEKGASRVSALSLSLAG